MLIFFFRFLFGGLIIFEFLNFVGVLKFPLDFSWLGLIITAAIVWLVIELTAYFLKNPQFLKIALPLSFVGIFIDFSGDIFRFYSQFGWYDAFAHFSAVTIVAYLIYLTSKKITADNRIVQSLLILGLSNLFGALYEIEEYLEDLIIRDGKWLRLGDGPDTANDLLFNLLGSLAIVFILNIRKINYRKAVNSLILLSTFYFLLSTVAFAAEPSDLKEAIDKKNQELQKINSQMQEIQENLEGVKKEGRTLKKEVGNIDKQVSQIKLGIRSSEVVIEKLGLEMESAQYKIAETENEINKKRTGIARALQELQLKEGESSLIIFLKNKSLAESAFEIQGLSDLSANLANEVVKMQSLKNLLSEKVDEISGKKQTKESEYYNLKNKQSIAEELKKNKQILLEQTKNQEKNYQKQLSELEKQQLAISDEIGDLEDELRRTFDVNLLPTKRPGVFGWPIKLIKEGGVGRITQRQGEISRLYRGRPHNGLDIGAPIGTSVYAAEDGKIEAVDNNDRSYYRKYQYGKYVLIKHNNNMTTLYAHLSKYIVKAGDIVKRGDLIGYSGNTGYSTGPHLHFGVYWAPSIVMKSIPPANGLVPIGVIINPEDYL